MMARLGISRETLPQRAGGQEAGEPDQPFAAVPSAHSHDANRIGWEDPAYDYSNSRLKNETVADFRPMEAATGRA
jgi:hypothetical protein